MPGYSSIGSNQTTILEIRNIPLVVFFLPREIKQKQAIAKHKRESKPRQSRANTRKQKAGWMKHKQ